MNIFEKMSAITAELNAVAKNLKVGEGRSAYSAVGEADVLAAVKPLEEKYKVYSYPVDRKIVDSDIITVKKTYNGSESESSKVYMRLETIYRFVNIEKPDEYIDIKTYGDGVDANDKAPGKAMTYGDKYALLKAYKIITGDDPDQNASEDGQRTGNQRTGSQRPAQEAIAVCSDCAKPIQAAKKKDGSPWAATDIVKYSHLRFDRCLCPACQRKVYQAEQAKQETAVAGGEV